MDEDRASWPLVVGITAGIVGGIIAAVYLYAVRMHDDSTMKLRDAKEIIDQCRQQINEIETSLETLKQPL